MISDGVTYLTVLPGIALLAVAKIRARLILTCSSMLAWLRKAFINIC